MAVRAGELRQQVAHFELVLGRNGTQPVGNPRVDFQQAIFGNNLDLALDPFARDVAAIRAAQLGLRITSYNVCYTKLLRDVVEGYLKTFEDMGAVFCLTQLKFCTATYNFLTVLDVLTQDILQTKYTWLDAIDKRHHVRNNFV